MPELEQVFNRYGAPMGRPSEHPGTDPHCTIRVRRLRLNSGGYDSGGAYWGHGAPLWHASGIDEFEGSYSDVSDFFRAYDKAAAIAYWRELWPSAKVY